MDFTSTSDNSPADDDLDALVAAIRACRLCRERPFGAPLPHAPRPVLRVSRQAPILLASQAPGTKVHASGLPFTDASGVRLRAWMGIDEAAFYDVTRLSIAPMGFCFPGQDAKGGDLPPRRECAATWHDRLFAALPQFRLVLLVGRPAQAYHFRRLGIGHLLRASLTETVAQWRAARDALKGSGGPRVYALPHPSWRNTGWIKRNPFFEEELLPDLRADVAALLAGLPPAPSMAGLAPGPSISGDMPDLCPPASGRASPLKTRALKRAEKREPPWPS